MTRCAAPGCDPGRVRSWREGLPLVIGHGTGLFSSLVSPARLVLVEAHTYPSVTAVHVYRTWPQAA